MDMKELGQRWGGSGEARVWTQRVGGGVEVRRNSRVEVERDTAGGGKSKEVEMGVGGCNRVGWVMVRRLGVGVRLVGVSSTYVPR